MSSFSTGAGHSLPGKLLYITSDHSFDFVPAAASDLQERTGASGVTSLTVGTFQLETSVETGELLYAWGYHPMASWKPSPLHQPTAQQGRVLVSAEPPLEAGASLPLPWENWDTRYDADSGIVRIGPEAPAGQTFIECATGIILGLSGDALTEIWLSPSFEDC